MYKLEIQSDGKLKFSVIDSFAQTQFVESSSPIPALTWSYVQIRFDGASIRLAAGPDPDFLDSQFTTFPGFSIATVSSDLTLGFAFQGNLDNFTVTKGGHTDFIEQIRYKFETIDQNGNTPDFLGVQDGIVVGAALDTGNFQEGLASIRFEGVGHTLTVPAGSEVDLTNGLELNFYCFAESGDPEIILERTGQYRLEKLSDRNLKFTVTAAGGAESSVTSTTAFPLNEWKLIRIRFEPNKIGVSHGRDVFSLITAEAELGMQFSPAATSADLVLGNSFVGNIDEFSSVKGGMAGVDAEAIGLSSDGTITTGPDGKARFFVRLNGNWDMRSATTVVINVEVSGSGLFRTLFKVTTKWIYKNVANCAKAFLLGSESLGDDASWFQRAAAWIGENLPIVSDLRTIGYEIYKAASGCDKVSLVNVGFAVVGLIADSLTFGTAGSAVRAAKVGTKAFFALGKTFIREFAKNGAMSLVAQQAMKTYFELASKRTLDSAEEQEPDWVGNGQAFMNDLKTWAHDGSPITDVVGESLQSAGDVFHMVDIYGSIPPGTEPNERKAQMEVFLNAMQEFAN